MTTRQSSIKRLKAQADSMARILVAAERGEKIDTPFAEKIIAARQGPSVIFAVAMDDKIIKLELAWDMIRDSGRAGVADYILDLMREKRRALNS